ncbi:uncharacterized protein HaLaN_26647, partial [Haematococcus lacustris]
MAPLLLLAGASVPVVVVVTPLFFGAAHFYHLHDLLLYQGASLKSAMSMVALRYEMVA